MNKERITDLFTRLVEVDSLSLGERQMADILSAELSQVGAMLSPWWTGGVGASGAQAHSQERQSSSQVQVGFLHLDMRVYFVNCLRLWLIQ